VQSVVVTIDERRQKAIQICEVVENTIVTLQSDRQTFSRFRDGATASEAVMRTHFPPTIARWYSQSVLSGLRRLGDRDMRSHSLRQLFDGMLAHPGDWTFDALLQLWDRTKHQYEPEMLELLAHATYGWVADASGRALNVSQVITDRARLDEILKSVRNLVNTTIAHADRKAVSPNAMTYNQLDETIYAVEDLAKRYIALLTGRGYSSEPGSMTPYEQTAVS